MLDIKSHRPAYFLAALYTFAFLNLAIPGHLLLCNSDLSTRTIGLGNDHPDGYHPHDPEKCQLCLSGGSAFAIASEEVHLVALGVTTNSAAPGTAPWISLSTIPQDTRAPPVMHLL